MTDPVRILAPVEPDEKAAGAGRLISALFPPAATEVHLFHVAPVVFSGFFIPHGFEGLDSLRRMQLHSLNRAAGRLARKFAPLERRGIRTVIETAAGSPLSEILRRITAGRYDLVVAGVGAQPGALGGVAAGLLHASSIPVLLFRDVRPGYRVSRVVFSTDFSSCSRQAAAWAILIAALSKAPLQMLHVGPEDGQPWSSSVRNSLSRMLEEEIRFARAEAARLGMPMPSVNATLRHAESASQGILEAAGDSTLVVMGTSGRTGLAGVIGSVARRVARACLRPVLTVGPSIGISAAETWRRVAPALKMIPMNQAPASRPAETESEVTR